MLRFRMLGLGRGKHSNNRAAAGQGSASGQTCWGMAFELIEMWKKCRKRRKKALNPSCAIFPTHVSSEPACHRHSGLTCSVCATSWGHHRKDAAVKWNIPTNVAFTLHQLQSVTRLLLFLVAEEWKWTSCLWHLPSNKQISEQRCSEKHTALRLLFQSQVEINIEPSEPPFIQTPPKREHQQGLCNFPSRWISNIFHVKSEKLRHNFVIVF